MHSICFLSAILLLTACSDKSSEDDSAGGTADDPTKIACDASFGYTDASGSELSFGECGRFGIEGGFEEDPGETPMLSDFSYIFRGGDSSGDCWVRWDQVQMCGAGYYPVDELGQLKWRTNDCPGLPSTGSSSVEATSGYVHVWASATELTASGETELIMQAVIHGIDAEGNTVSGGFQFTELIPTTVGSSSVCTVSTGDDDQDSYISTEYGGDDCDDSAVLTHPGGVETCDGTDENCNGRTDEGIDKSAWYEDADGDGFGDDATEVQACDGQEPDDSVEIGNDCDDDNPAVNPGAAEICDGLDNDCDTVADEGGVCGR